MSITELAKQFGISQSGFSQRMKTEKFTQQELEKQHQLLDVNINLFLDFHMVKSIKALCIFCIDKEVIKITVRDQIKAACDVAGISATELGVKMGMSQQTFSSRLKVGKFSKSEYEQMAEILGAKFIFRFEFPDGTRI